MRSPSNQPFGSNQTVERQPLDREGPITQLTSQAAGIAVLDEPVPGAVAEIDTLSQGSSDSDTI